ncbi:MAG: Serine/threonine protein phosphatase [uncultured Sulfurovum sp.]|uniref:Serine/threonine protein phosphatase n=1 Tax=uncultured Sulfurovum sp. TaxID=269237 RepID=A0A6S6RU53_9BACT|nr:MAG: Serine/threonine protein phosphatase [uncultured Sulfurovum sp.]
MNNCVVGDVHGEYKSLINLVAKTPEYSQLIFVGDLVDRGSQSAHVVRFVRTHELPCVLGNHEVMMIEHGSQFVKDIKNNNVIEQDNIWLKNGGRETLLSYGLVSINNGEMVVHPFIQEFIFQFEDDIEWMKKLPLYLELDTYHPSGRKVIVSHSAIAPVWNLKDSNDDEKIKKFTDIVLWGRVKPMDTEPIFNIFGHTPQKYSTDINKHYVNIDTGCYMKEAKGYGLLSAYCIETEEVYSSSDLAYEKVS